MIVLIRGNNFVATANSKGLFEDLDDFGPAREHPVSYLQKLFRLHIATRLLQSLKEVEKEKARAGRQHSVSPNTPPATYHLSGLGQVTPPRCGDTGDKIGPRAKWYLRSQHNRS